MSDIGSRETIVNLKRKLDDDCALVDQKLNDLLPQDTMRIGESRLAAAMRYSTLAPGKRLRPFLVMRSAALFGVSETSALRTACAIECIHAYSLVHDDLPALDNDDTRRGQPSCHKQFDEATAILAGDALLTLAFEIVSHPDTHVSPNVRADMTLAIAQACGVRGMVGGQMLDIISERSELNIEEITRLQRMKTGALFAVSCEAGAILGRAPDNARNALRGYANNIGLAFQITDDLLDATAEANSGRMDKSSMKGTYVGVMGVEKSRKQAQLLVEQAVSFLEVFGKRADMLKDLARFIVDRKH